jgi:hypothetical protein
MIANQPNKAGWRQTRSGDPAGRCYGLLQAPSEKRRQLRDSASFVYARHKHEKASYQRQHAPRYAAKQRPRRLAVQQQNKKSGRCSGSKSRRAELGLQRQRRLPLQTSSPIG